MDQGIVSLYAEFTDTGPSCLLKFYPLSLTAIIITETERHAYEDLPETEQTETLKKTFKNVDKDQDGRINKADLLLAMRKNPELSSLMNLGASVRAGDGSMQQFEATFEKLDRDQSGDLDWYEFSSLAGQSVS